MKPLIIYGPRRSGKSREAVAQAAKLGSYVIVDTIGDLPSLLLSNKPDVVIVEEVTSRTLDTWSPLQDWPIEDSITVAVKYKEPTQMKTPKLIIVAHQSTEMNDIVRRFTKHNTPVEVLGL